MVIQRFYSGYLRLTVKILLDITAFLAAFILSYLLRFSFGHFLDEVKQVLMFLPFIILVRVLIFAFFRLYAYMWRYSGTHDLLQILKASTLGTVAIISALYFIGHISLPRSVVATDWLMVVFFTGGVRLATRRFFALDWRALRERDSFGRVLIFGAGGAGEQLLRNIENTREVKVNVVGFLDDDPNKKGHYLHNKKVLGDRTKIGELVKKHNISDIYFSIPSLPGKEVRELLKLIHDQVEDNVEIKTMPGLTDLVAGRVSFNQLRRFEIRDLLRRKPVNMDYTPVKELIKGKTVLVVGGGGSIGLELCSQIASFEPERLLILDSSEYNLYTAEGSIQERYPDLKMVPIVADAANEPLMRRILGKYRPSLLFHAAAYKHVPLMEINPWSAVQNNLTSTMTLCRLATEYEVDRFILISTDKAVQPTSVMGATKRICEIIARIFHKESVTKFIVVRFGNVLGSSGSVILRFKEQIAKGGPITVTHPEITRYFMLISEAVELVLQAGAIGESGNIYVLDMGEPIPIIDLAKYMIELSGLKEDEDIKIIYTGLRLGEKLHESLYFEGEESATHVPNLLVLEPKSDPGSKYLSKVDKMISNLYYMNYSELISHLREFVPEYRTGMVDNSLIGDVPELKEKLKQKKKIPRIAAS